MSLYKLDIQYSFGLVCCLVIEMKMHCSYIIIDTSATIPVYASHMQFVCSLLFHLHWVLCIILQSGHNVCIYYCNSVFMLAIFLLKKINLVYSNVDSAFQLSVISQSTATMQSFCQVDLLGTSVSQRGHSTVVQTVTLPCQTSPHFCFPVLLFFCISLVIHLYFYFSQIMNSAHILEWNGVYFRKWYYDFCLQQNCI